MKTTNRLALLAGFGMALAGFSVYSQSEPAQPPGPPHARFGEVLQGVIAQYDANKDGQLEPSEMAALQQDIANGKVQPPGPLGAGPRALGGGPQRHLPQEVIDQYDGNKDGQLDETERAALRADIESGKLPPPALGRGPRGPMGQAMSAKQILAAFDADKDGKLDEAELKAFLDSRPGPGPLHRRAGGPRLGQPPAGAAPQHD